MITKTKGIQTAITGMGIVSAAGQGVNAVWEAVLSGESPERAFSPKNQNNAPTCAVASIRDLDVEELLTRRVVQDTDRTTHLALLASEEAMKDAHLVSHEQDGDLAIVVGTGFGAIGSIGEHMAIAALNPTTPLSPLAIPKGMSNATSFWLARRWEAFGPNLTVSTACSSGAMALVMADRLIRDGDVQRVLVCGVDACLTPSVLRAWSGMRVMTNQPAGSKAFRPFDANRSGFVLGEGAACVVCEAAEYAEKRGAHIYGFVESASTSCDAQSLTRPDGQRQAQTIIRALERASVKLNEVAFVNAHGTATKLNDSTEAQALRLAFGETIVPVQASKPFFGHTMGASGILEFILGLIQLKERRLHPTPHLEEVDPDCELAHVMEWTELDEDKPFFVSNSFGFGGNNVVLVGRT